jgi:GH25 family lysozyme M1 (1,4-beta-N-acetylmuramidase)
MTLKMTDVSHHQGSIDWAKVKGSGVVGTLIKATTGIGGKDPLYTKNLEEAKAQGLVVGPYHFGTGSDPEGQADFFLETIGDPKGLLIALDFETNTEEGGTTMSLAQARAFVQRIHEKIGRFPIFYSFSSFLEEQLGDSVDPILGNCPLWIARYGPQPDAPPTWNTITIWQHTNGVDGPEPEAVPGITENRSLKDKFFGTMDELIALAEGEEGVEDVLTEEQASTLTKMEGFLEGLRAGFEGNELPSDATGPFAQAGQALGKLAKQSDRVDIR